MDKNLIKHIIIVGGGSAGWMSATYLRASLDNFVHITVIESPSIERIGVGEATVTTIKTEFFDRLKISEREWMPQCKGSYKMGIQYRNWKKPPEEGGDYYYHIFGEIPYIDEVPLTHLWIKKRLEENYQIPMAYACYNSIAAIDANKSPKHFDDTRAHYYAYHFDASLLANFLKNWSISNGINYIEDNLTHAVLNETGDIQYVVGSNGQKYHADLFIDCSGFAGFLIEKTLKEPIVSFGDSLLTDRAIAINFHEAPEHDGIRPYTTATALKAGWMWEIPHYNTSGNGYVYSSQFISDTEAENEIRQFFGKKAEHVDVRKIKFQSRRRRNAWVKNCVSIGLSSNFLEPLESTGLYFVYAALYQLIRNFPTKTIDPILRDKFNQKIRFMVDEMKDFILMHFKTCGRTDTPFWLANRYETKLSDSLALILERHRAGLPIKTTHQTDLKLYATFGVQFDNFWTNTNYQSILCGVDWLPDKVLPLLNYRPDIIEKGDLLFKKLAQESSQLLKTLPSQFDYLKKIYAMHEPIYA
ncbi:tryptophan halogenase family protein [Legionella oakridgensis]|uniref:tryptophan halogenase family protein n=1 Tax=Legionella oakridgensis TaxID=29423 RepID=UPI0003DE4259|nr:tryptophan halogenase family protein [Legionella oakridgensis]ETO92077.1 tryptophan halogenase [Legionella oakridgensis RV-2-2007]